MMRLTDTDRFTADAAGVRRSGAGGRCRRGTFGPASTRPADLAGQTGVSRKKIFQKVIPPGKLFL